MQPTMDTTVDAQHVAGEQEVQQELAAPRGLKAMVVHKTPEDAQTGGQAQARKQLRCKVQGA